MCMIAAAVTKNFGVLATDSAKYDIEKAETIFDSQKLYFTLNNKYLATFIGTPLYLTNLDQSKFALSLDGLSMYLKEYLRGMKPKVAEMMKAEIADEDDRQPNVCLFVLGMHKGVPTLAQFNVFQNFEPKYLWTKGDDIKFSNIFFGGEVPGKNEVFKQATEYMEKKMARYQKMKVHPGIIGEVLTRGIYKKADLEEKLDGNKFAGGVVNVAFVNSKGLYSLSGVNPIRVE